MSQTVFLSSVSGEFGPMRRRLASLTQRTKKCHVRHQDEFFHRGVRTLQKLVEEIQESDLVVHLIGVESGWCVHASQTIEYLDANPKFESRFPAISKQARGGELPATQWEAWLGLFYGKRLFAYQLLTDKIEDLQSTHLERLKSLKEHPQEANDRDALFDEVVGSLITHGVFSEEDIRRPIKLPYPSIGTLFKGRDDFLEQLRISLQQSTDHRATAITGKAVHGLGGVGKTRLAVEYAWQHAEQYSAVLCVTADSPENLRRNLAELAGPLVLDLAEQAVVEEDVRLAAALRWLQDHPGWFLILDNVDTEDAVEAVESLLADLRGGQVLITSRLSRFGDAIESLELDVMSTKDGANFLLEKTKTKGNRGRKKTDSDQQDALELATELDGLALALDQAGAYIVQLRKSLAEYLELWRSHQSSVQEWLNNTIKYAGPTNAPLRSVAVTWKTTIQQMGEAEEHLLNLLAWFAPDPIPLSIFEQFAKKDSPPTLREEGSTEPADAKVSLWSETEFRELLANLADFSMLQWDIETDTVTVHRVVQEILRTQQDDPKKKLELVLQMLNTSVPDGDPSDVRTWSAWEPLRSHVVFAAEEADKLEIAVPTSGLMGQVGTLFWAMALHSSAEKLERRALAIDQQQFGTDSTEAAMRMSNLAETLKATNRLEEAEPMMRRALSIDEASCGTEHPNVAIHLNNLAQLLKATNRLEEAEPMMRRALSIGEASYGTEHPQVAIRLNNLALLLQATNRLEEAEPMMRRALSINEASYGTEHPNVAISLNNLAQLLQATNRLGEAEPMMRRALSIDEASYGTEHPQVAIRLNNLALLLKATTRLEEAEPMMRRALSIDEASYGTEHPQVAIRLNNLALLLKATNRLEEAEPMMRRALSIDEASYGTEHPKVAIRLNNLAQLLKATNRLEEAEPMMRRALSIDEASYGTEHPNVAIRLNNLAQLLKATNRLEEAEPMMRRALSVFEASYGNEHPQTRTAFDNYFRLLVAMGMSEEDAIERIKLRLRDSD